MPRSTGPLDVFIHMPKAAGTSIRSLIDHNYELRDHVRIYTTGRRDMDAILTKLRDNGRLGKGRIVYGHIPAIVHRFTDRKINYFTFLRDPVDRAISFFKYVKYDFPAHKQHKEFASGQVTFSDFCRMRHSFFNKMTSMLAGYDRTDDHSDAMLDEAKRALEGFAYFGFAETFEESTRELAKVLGWDLGGIETRNVSSRSNRQFIEEEGASEADIEVLRERNKYDVAIYDFARQLKGRGA